MKKRSKKKNPTTDLTSWNSERRKMLETLVGEGFQVTKISELMSRSRYSIYTELKRGLTDEEYRDKRYAKYSAKRAVYNLVKDWIDKDGFEMLTEYIMENKDV